MKSFICRVLIVAFSCNILLPETALFAQHYTEDSSDELYNELYLDDAYPGARPSPLAPEQEEILLDTPWAAYTALSAYKEQEPTEDILGHPINYNAQKDAKAIKRGIATQDAKLRQFLANSPKEPLVEWLSKNELPQDDWQMGMNEYIPGLHLKKAAGESAKAALKNLTILQQNQQLTPEDLLELIKAPSAEIASFAGMSLYSTLQDALTVQDPLTIYMLLGFAPQMQNIAASRLDASYSNPQANRAATPGHRLVQKLAPKQTESAQSIEMRGILNVLLADISRLYKVSQDPQLRPLLEQQDQMMWPMGENTFLTPDPMPDSFYKKQKNRLLHSLDYARTLKERVQGINNERILNADYVAMALITYDGVDGFKRLVDYIDEENTNLNGRKQQYRLDQYNFPFLKSAFDYLALFYLPKLSSREVAMDQKEKNHLVNTLINYANHGSAPVQVLALDLLTRIYQETSPKWTRGQGYDKGAAGGPAISTQTANQVADRIKKIYCHIDQAVESVYGLNSAQMQEMADQLAQSYRRVRRDPQGQILPANKDGKAIVSQQCYVRDVQERNQFVYAKEMADDAMGFVLSWVAIGGAFQAVGKGVSYTAQIARTANQARKLPVGQRIAYFKGTLKQIKQAKQAAKELSNFGVKVERVVERPAAKPSAFTQKVNALKQKMGMKVKEPSAQTYVVNALKETNPKGTTLGYRITQRLPGGKEQITTIEGEVISRGAFNPNMPAKLGAEKGTLNSVTELAEKYITKIPQGVSPAAYKEAIATENLFRTGLEEVSSANFKSGFGMKKVWYLDGNQKLFSVNEPIWVDLAKSSQVVHNGAGIPLTGMLRNDLIKTVSTPGGVLTATASVAGKGGLNYLWKISKWTGEFAAADVAFHPLSQALDGQYQNAPDGAPWYAEIGQYFNNVGNAILNYDEAAGTSIIFPFAAAWKGVSTAWDKVIRSNTVDGKEMSAQVENNPYLKEYRQKVEKLQQSFNTDAKSLVALWEQAQTNPDDTKLQEKLAENYQQMDDKYATQETGGIAQQWQSLYEALLLGINPFDYEDAFSGDDYYF